MKAKKISNSKYKNTGVLFELLVNQITADTFAEINESDALNIMKKYFNASTELGKELQLYRAFFDSNRLSEAKAIHFIDLILEQRKKLDEKKLAREKYDLINEIKVSYDLDSFLSARVPSYTIHASIYKTFATQDAKNQEANIVNISEVAQARFTLVEQLAGVARKQESKKDDAILEEFRAQTEDLRLLSFKLAVDRFNEKYSGLNDKQKQLLHEYIENVTNTNSLVKYVRTEIPYMKQEIAMRAKATTDKVLAIKLNEVSSQLDKIGAKSSVRDNEITAMMIAYEIIKEASV